jgi:hypothetical protein
MGGTATRPLYPSSKLRPGSNSPRKVTGPSCSVCVALQNNVTVFDVHMTVYRDKFPYASNKPTRCTNFSNLFWKDNLHVSDSSSVHHQEFSLYTRQWYMSYSFADSSRAGFCSQAVSKPVWHIPLLCVQWKIPDGGQRNCPKHIECPSKINLRN